MASLKRPKDSTTLNTVRCNASDNIPTPRKKRNVKARRHSMLLPIPGISRADRAPLNKERLHNTNAVPVGSDSRWTVLRDLATQNSLLQHTRVRTPLLLKHDGRGRGNKQADHKPATENMLCNFEAVFRDDTRNRIQPVSHQTTSAHDIRNSGENFGVDGGRRANGVTRRKRWR